MAKNIYKNIITLYIMHYACFVKLSFIMHYEYNNTYQAL